MAYIEQSDIFEATNGGLDIILQYYPNAQESVDRPNKKFKIRGNEKTASASIKRLSDGVWVVTDFGDDQKPRNAIQIVMLEENVQFKQALDIIASQYNIKGSSDTTLFKPEFEKRDATAEEKEGEYFFDLAESLTEEQLKVLGPQVTQKVCDKYNVYAVNSFTYIKDRKALITKATEHYPIFVLDMGKSKKIFQPKSMDKQYRFRYAGGRPADYIFGLEQCRKDWAALQSDNTESENKREAKLPEIILCSGDRDALNVAGMGYNVIWMNSESAKLTGKQYKQIMELCEEFYNLPDIDKTGIKQGNELAMMYLDMKTIRLPEELGKRKDFRGNACKDLRDFLNYYQPRHFKELMRTALPLRLWDEVYKMDKNGEYLRTEYAFNNVQAYNFLKVNGFYRYRVDNEKDGYTYIRIKGNIVQEIDANDIKAFVNGFLEQRKMNIALRNTFYKTNQLAESSLSNLPIIEIDFSDFDKHCQYLFFENRTWRVTKDGIEDYRPGEVEKYVWEDEVIKHRVTLEEDYFTVSYDKALAEFDIEIHNKECLFFQYLINSSRIHWRKEMEEGIPLHEDEIYEQKHHLINKMYSLGYLLHRYKDPSRPWCVFAMDNKISEQGESHGGSGKSIAYKAPRYFMKSVTLDGRNPKLTDNPHIYERVTEHTDYILVDDANQYLKFGFFFSPLTGELTVNPKNNKQYEIPFEHVPKFCITSNYTLREIDPSTERRLLYTVFSDYYHYNSNGEYNESRSPKDDFGKNLFLDFDEADWNRFFNFMAQCLKMYLNFEKIDPPMDNVTKRNLRTLMTEQFQTWADVYFAEETRRTDCMYPKKAAFLDFLQETKVQKWTINKFTKSMKYWCVYNNYVFNPKELCNSDNRIIGKDESNMSEEKIYIQTKEIINHEQKLPF